MAPVRSCLPFFVIHETPSTLDTLNERMWTSVHVHAVFVRPTRLHESAGGMDLEQLRETPLPVARNPSGEAWMVTQADRPTERRNSITMESLSPSVRLRLIRTGLQK